MALEGVVDPISLEPLLSLPYAPFELRADPSLVCTDNDWFDGHVLSHYLVSTGTFLHPISRRELTRDECASLDSYLVQHKVTEARASPCTDEIMSRAQADDCRAHAHAVPLMLVLGFFLRPSLTRIRGG